MKIKTVLSFLVLLVCMTQSSIYGQDFEITDLYNNGTHSFTSPYPDSHLHFYLFGDGYHSFESEPTHIYDDLEPINGYEPVVYQTGPYTNDDVIGESIDNSSSGAANPNNAPVEMDSSMIELKASWNLVQNDTNFYLLMFQNTTTDLIPFGCVEFHYTSSKNKVIAYDILDDYNNGWVFNRQFSNSYHYGYNKKFKWDFTDLEPGEQRFVYIPAICKRPAFDKVKTLGKIYVGCSETSQSSVLNSTVSNNPHDPNILIPRCRYLDSNANSISVKYRAYFQNDGVDPAQNVRVDFRTDHDYTNIVLLNSSYQHCTMTWGLCQTSSPVISCPIDAQFFFDEIYLDGMNQTSPVPRYEQTIGWVDFMVCYDLSNMTYPCIEHAIDIDFDGQPLVNYTGQLCRPPTLNSYGIVCDKDYCPPRAPLEQSINRAVIRENTIDENIDYILYPNPSSEFLNIEPTSGYMESSVELSILDINNKTCTKVQNGSSRVDISNLLPGIYNVLINTDGKIKIKRFVKI